MSENKLSNDQLLLEARPSQRVGGQRIEGDGDTWQETLAVCEAPSSKPKNSTSSAGKLIIRSYFQNNRSGKRVWDEPPSGASQILPATEEMRRMAEMQLAELHLVTGQTQSQLQTQSQTQSHSQDSEPRKRRSFFGFGKKKEKDKGHTTQTKIRYKPGSALLTIAPGNDRGDSDAQLQEAIARSLAESQGIPYNGNVATLPIDDDELAMAKALSLSAAQESGETEEQLLARVLEESRIEDAIQRGAYHAALSEPEYMHVQLHSDWNDQDKKPAARQTPAPSTLKQPPGISDQLLPSSSNPHAAVSTPTSNDRSPPRSPVSPFFDPYAKDAPSPVTKVISEKPTTSLQKMDPNTISPRLNWGKRTTKKVKDQAGLV